MGCAGRAAARGIQRRQHFGTVFCSAKGSSGCQSVSSCRRGGDCPATSARSIQLIDCNAGHTEHQPLQPQRHLSDPKRTAVT
eukprot:9496196-Pyramimonas_sp.AAC.1